MAFKTLAPPPANARVTGCTVGWRAHKCGRHNQCVVSLSRETARAMQINEIGRRVSVAYCPETNRLQVTALPPGDTNGYALTRKRWKGKTSGAMFACDLPGIVGEYRPAQSCTVEFDGTHLTIAMPEWAWPPAARRAAMAKAA